MLLAQQGGRIVDMGLARPPHARRRLETPQAPPWPPDQPISAATATISGKGRTEGKDRDEGRRGDRRIAVFFSARLPTRTTACSTMASTAAFSPKNSAETNADIAPDRIDPAQRHDRHDARAG